MILHGLLQVHGVLLRVCCKLLPDDGVSLQSIHVLLQSILALLQVIYVLLRGNDVLLLHNDALLHAHARLLLPDCP